MHDSLSHSAWSQSPTSLPEQWLGTWRAELESSGGPVEFGLVLAGENDALQAFVTNGPETIKVPQVNWDGEQLRLGFPHYQSALIAAWDPERKQLTGQWTRKKGAQQVAQLRFCATRDGKSDPAYEACEPWLGKWRVQFNNSPEPAIGLFRRDTSATDKTATDKTATEASTQTATTAHSAEAVVGTFLTSTGDYRYLAGGVRNQELILSCFDGTHVYRFASRLTEDGHLAGKFWSGSSSPQTWTAERDDAISLPDGFRLTRAQGEVDWGALQFPDLTGKPRRLDDPEFQGRVRLVYLFGSWCPNCHDAAVFFGTLQTEYGPRGLQTLGLAFEATGDFEQDAQQVDIYRTRHEIRYPLLVAGLADKEFATRSLPFLDRVRSFPTAILVDAQGKIRDVYTGFNGPATGEAYTLQGEAFRKRIESLLAEQR